MGVSVEKVAGVGFLPPWVQPSANLKAQTLTQPSPLPVEEEEEEDGVAVMDQYHQISTLSASQGGINKHLQWYLLFHYSIIEYVRGHKLKAHLAISAGGGLAWSCHPD